MIPPLPREMGCCESTRWFEGGMSQAFRCVKPALLRVLPCSCSSPMSFSQELVAPIAPPRGLGFLHPRMGAAFSHQAIGWGFVTRNHLKEAAKVKDSPWSTLLVPEEPNSHHCSKEDHFPHQQPLTSLTLAIHVQFSSATSLRCVLLVPQVSLGRLHPGLCGCLEQETAMLLRLCYSVENCLHRGHFDS